MNDEDEWKKNQKNHLKKILARRKGIRFFKSKEEEYSVMVKESIDFLNNVFESNKYTMEQELNYPFKYTEKDIQNIKDFFEDANNEWILADHSPFFKKHMELFDYALENNKRNQVKKYKYKKDI